MPYGKIKGHDSRKDCKNPFFGNSKSKEVKSLKITKKLCAALTCAVLLFVGFVLPTQAAVPSENQQRASVLTPASEVPITMNGKRVLKERAYLLNETTYVALRDFCDLLGGIEVSWNSSSQTALMEQGKRQVMATIGTSYILADGRCFYSVQPIRLIEGKTYAPIRALAKSFGVEVEWNASNHSITLKNTGDSLLRAEAEMLSSTSGFVSLIMAGTILICSLSVWTALLRPCVNPIWQCGA